ncbi:hypothetical protein LV457_10160 [Mycobacterium sp. MYCO198283]|uniref:WGxxGxxG family protein n=1 Tax=Mycobacterium sp. MYCO198283 TaxID=2883505 RepID=UPI001E532827|nr:WGxxGxxG family protein [Mycobacterium sp. MYCO198283]MCG5432650.1 hypothetical protein [Mycobacterium sp. MYCO198283]
MRIALAALMMSAGLLLGGAGVAAAQPVVASPAAHVAVVAADNEDDGGDNGLWGLLGLAGLAGLLGLRRRPDHQGVDRTGGATPPRG